MTEEPSRHRIGRVDEAGRSIPAIVGHATSTVRGVRSAAYSTLGVRDVWRVDLRDRCVVVKTGAAIETPHEEECEWHPAEIARPLTISVQALFAEIQGDD